MAHLSHSPAYEVSISGSKVELTCPEDSESEEITWQKENGPKEKDKGRVYTLDNFSEMDDSGYYRCYIKESKEKDHYLYLKARGNMGL